MTRVSKYLMAAAAATMSVAPAMASQATPLTAVDTTRAATTTENDSDLRGGNVGIFIALAAGIAIIVAIIIVGSDESDVPTSP